MHQRKAEMARHSDAFIALPGLFIVHINQHGQCPCLPSTPNREGYLSFIVCNLFNDNSPFISLFSLLIDYIFSTVTVKCTFVDRIYASTITVKLHLAFVLRNLLALINKSNIIGLQNEDGSFSGDIWGEIETRFSYVAI